MLVYKDWGDEVRELSRKPINILLFLAVIKEFEHLMLLIGNVSIVNEYRETLDRACHILQISRDSYALPQNEYVLGLTHGISMTVLESILPDSLQPQTCLLIRPLQNVEHLVFSVLLHSRVQ